MLKKIKNVNRIFAIGLNYINHINNSNAPLPQSPELFIMPQSTLNQNNGNVFLPSYAYKYDYEGELVTIIDQKCHNVSVNEAKKYIWGYTIGNDITARDLQFKGSQWFLGKSLDGFSPISDYGLPQKEFDFNHAKLITKRNGKIVQNSLVNDMLFKPAEIISYLSKFICLYPGDLIFCGTPGGVILEQTNPKWLSAGEKVEVHISQLGTLSSTFN